MMKHFYLKVVLFSLLCIAGGKASAQLANPPFFVETIVHYGNYGEANHDLTGYVTYRVYIQFANNDNYLTSIFAAESPPDCIQDADSTVFFDFDCGVFQHEFGTAYGFSEPCLYPGLIPSSEWDSYLTIGQECSNDPTCDIVNTLGQCLTWVDDFEGTAGASLYDGADFFWDENAIFSASCFQPYPTSICHADANNRVLIGQFTTCGDMNGCMNISFVDQNSNDQQVFDICFEATHPCLTNTMDITPDITLAGCAGQSGAVEFDGGGNGDIDYTLFTSGDVLVDDYPNETGGVNITPIDPGTYYVTMIDAAGCRDTTADFSVTAPDILQFDATLLTDVLCFGETTGSIELECSGGTGQITIVMNNNQQMSCGTILNDLGCGTYTFIAEDDNNCQQFDTIQVACPQQLVYNPVVDVIDCFGDDDGSITGSVTGGTGIITADWSYSGGPFLDDFSGNSPLNITITGLDSGVYDVLIEDTNGCTLEDSFEITEPGEYLATFPFTDATCFAFCDGTIIPEITGGTEPFTITGTVVGGGGVDLEALCAGDVHVIITDDNGCVIEDTITISEPTDITYALELTSVSCFGNCDGAIDITEVDGSFGGYTYEISPNTGNCEAPCSGSEAHYTDLCAGTFDVTITDQEGCEKLIPDVVIITPAAIELILTPTDVTCYGLSDGEVFVEVIGGTEPIVITPSDSIAPATIGGFAIGTYTFSIEDANGCTASEDVIIEQPDSLYATALTIENASCGGICDGTLTYQVFGGTIPYDYQLLPVGSTGPVNGFLSSLCANEYELVINDLYNCADTLEFEIIEPDPLVINSLLNAPTCTGMFDGSAVIELSGGTGELQFFIEPEDTDAIELDSVTYNLSGLGEGELYFQLTDEEGCALLDTLVIVPDIITDMVLTTFSTPETCWNETDGTAAVAVQNGNLPISFEWDDPDMQITATAVGLSSSQEYTVVVTDDIGCTLTTSVFVEPTVGCFFIATAITPNGDGVNDAWILGGFEYFPDCKINVFNRWGQLVYSSKGYNAQWDATYQGELLPVADYYFTIDYAPDKDEIMGTVTIKY